MKKLFINKKPAAFVGLLLATFVALYITSCSKKDFGNNIATPLTVVSGVRINVSDTLYLLQGKDSTLSFSVSPDSAYNKALQWKSSDSSIATVKDGTIHTAGLGMTTLTAQSTDGTLKSASVVVAVIDHITQVTSISFTNMSGDTSIYEGDSLSLKAIITPTNVTYKTLQWSSSNPSVATVSATGTIKGLTTGTAKITATSTDGGNVSASVNINILEVVPVQSISLTNMLPEGLSLGNVYKLNYTVLPANATISTLVWSSSDPTILSVAQDGTVTAIGAGQARISVTSKYDATVSSYIDIMVVAGKINDVFTGTTTPWITPTASATGVIQNGQFVVKMALNGKYRGDFQRKGGAVLHAGSYPIIAFKMERPTGAAGGANVTFDTNLGSFGNAANKFTTLTDDNGNTIYYYNIATGTFGANATKLSTTTATTLSTFQLKVADLVLTDNEVSAGKNIYHVTWVKSFKSLEELQANINN